jgi:hypothetical protein
MQKRRRGAASLDGGRPRAEAAAPRREIRAVIVSTQLCRGAGCGASLCRRCFAAARDVGRSRAEAAAPRREIGAVVASTLQRHVARSGVSSCQRCSVPSRDVGRPRADTPLGRKELLDVRVRYSLWDESGCSTARTRNPSQVTMQ